MSFMNVHCSPIGPIRCPAPQSIDAQEQISNKRLVDAIAFLDGISTTKSRNLGLNWQLHANVILTCPCHWFSYRDVVRASYPYIAMQTVLINSRKNIHPSTDQNLSIDRKRNRNRYHNPAKQNQRLLHSTAQRLILYTRRLRQLQATARPLSATRDYTYLQLNDTRTKPARNISCR